MDDLRVERFAYNGRKVPGVRSFMVGNVVWGSARSVSLRGVWVIKNHTGKEIGSVEPTGTKYAKDRVIDQLLLEQGLLLRAQGLLTEPPAEAMRLQKEKDAADNRAKVARERIEKAAPEMLDAITFIKAHDLLGGPYHLKDQAARKIRLAMEKMAATTY